VGEERSRDRFPEGERIIPAHLLTPIDEWNKRLGLPDVNIIDVINDEGKTNGKRANIIPLQAQVIEADDDTREAFYSYDEALLDMIDTSENQDLDGNYARFSEKALRVALLLASMSGSDTIKMCHFAKAQAITERWRYCLHSLYDQLNEPPESAERDNEERILRMIKKKGSPTEREISQAVRMSRAEIKVILATLQNAEEIVKKKNGNRIEYHMLRPE
jgi:hypothetical protein